MCIWPTMRSWKRWRWGLLLHRRAQPDLLRHYRQVRLHCFLCAHQSRQPPDLPAHRAAPLHLSRFRIRAGEDDAAFFDWRREHHVTVGHDVWIGHNAILMPGVSVGNGAVIGSAAVVTRTWSLQHRRRRGGQKIGMRFDDALIERIERSQWWHWDHATLQARLADFATSTALRRSTFNGGERCN